MNSKVLKHLFRYLKKYKGKFTISVLAAFVGTLFTVIAPRLLGDVTTVLYAGITDHVWFVGKLTARQILLPYGYKVLLCP